jgi:tetratricopeptide (TPR) repeat protein
MNDQSKGVAPETADEVEKHRTRKWKKPFLYTALAVFVLATTGYVTSWQGSLDLPLVGNQGDVTKLDGFESEIDRAVELIVAEKNEEAKSLLDEIVSKAPNHVLANYNLGVIAHFDGRLPEAIRHYTVSLSNDPLFRSALYNRGLANRDIGDFDQAIADLSTLVANYPNSAAGAYNLGKLFIEQGDTEKGEALLARAKRLDPSLGN